MDFAPYQSSPPEHARALSPPRETTFPRSSWDAIRRPFSPAAQAQAQHHQRGSPPSLQHPQPQRGWPAGGIRTSAEYGYQYQSQRDSPAPGGTAEGARDGLLGAGGGGGGFGDYIGGGAGRDGLVSEFDTSLGLRLDVEACLTYVAMPPLGAIVLLILERKSDYVRFHAWQAALLFTVLFILHLVFSGSTFLTWILGLGDVALVVILAMKAYRDADTLDRYEVPIIGPLASGIVDDE